MYASSATTLLPPTSGTVEPYTSFHVGPVTRVPSIEWHWMHPRVS